jgi:tetratricopeptide (TPR) repeat protein
MNDEMNSAHPAPDDPEECLRDDPALRDELKKLFLNLGSLNGALGPGKELGDFKIVKEIDSGGMGTVYEARQVSLDRTVALKVLSPHLSLQVRAVEKFAREALAGGRQQHPGIVSIHAMGEHEGIHFIAMEWVNGGRSLAHLLEETRRQGRPPDRYYHDIAELIRDTAEALQHAHASGVVHRDVKPPNILLTPDGRPKISDFGLAHVEDALTLSRSGDFSGTAYYMSPEQVTGQHEDVDERTDIYSLGVTLYECLTLQTPFKGKSTHDVLKKIILHEPRDPTRLAPDVPRDLSVICLKAMEKDPESRYPTMYALADDLQRFLDGRAISARPVNSMVRAVRRAKRHPYAVAGAAVGLLLAVAAALFFYAVETDADRQEHAKKAQALNAFVQSIVTAPPAGKAETINLAAKEAVKEFKGTSGIEIAIQNCQAMALRNIGQPARAEPIMRKVLDYRVAQLGPEHLDTNVARNNLAMVLSDLGKLEESEELLQAVVANHRRELGEEHLNTILVMNNLIALQDELGRFEEAEKNYRALLDLCIRTQGEEHEETLRIKHNFSTLLIRMGKLDEAEPMVRKTCEQMRRVLGRENLLTLKSLINLGRVLVERGRTEEAEDLLRDVEETCTRILGEEHPTTLSCRHALVSVHLHAGRLEEAETLGRRVVECRARKLGEAVPGTLMSRKLLAEVLRRRGDLEEAESLIQDALDTHRRCFGDEHPDTWTFAESLARIMADKAREVRTVTAPSSGSGRP